MAADTITEIEEIVTRTGSLVDSTTTADAIAYLLSVHRLIEQHPDCTPILRRQLTMEGALFCLIIQQLDLEAWRDGFALFQEDCVEVDRSA